MKRNFLKPLLFFVILFLAGLSSKAQVAGNADAVLGVKQPWTSKESIEPTVLAAELKNGANPLIFNIGAVEDIEGAKHIGPAEEATNLKKLRTTVATLPKNKPLVIYCGCCPFAKCPNVRPAYFELKKLGFTNIKVLNLATNLKTDWIAKGYPLNK